MPQVSDLLLNEASSCVVFSPSWGWSRLMGKRMWTSGLGASVHEGPRAIQPERTGWPGEPWAFSKEEQGTLNQKQGHTQEYSNPGASGEHPSSRRRQNWGQIEGSRTFGANGALRLRGHCVAGVFHRHQVASCRLDACHVPCHCSQALPQAVSCVLWHLIYGIFAEAFPQKIPIPSPC